MMLQQLMQKIGAGAGAGGGAPGGPGPGGVPMAGGDSGAPGGGGGMTVASPADQQGDALSKELSIMRATDPMMVSREINAIKQRVLTLINHTGMSLPGVARQMSKMLASIDGALEAANKAATTMNIVSPPMGTSVLPPSFPQSSGGDPTGGGS